MTRFLKGSALDFFLPFFCRLASGSSESDEAPRLRPMAKRPPKNSLIFLGLVEGKGKPGQRRFLLCFQASCFFRDGEK